MNPPDAHQMQRMQINANTGISIGIIIVVIGGVWAVMNGIGGIRNEIGLAQAQQAQNRVEFMAKIEKIESKVTALENNKNTWTSTDMFRWAVHLQQSNPSMKVPEPEVNTK